MTPDWMWLSSTDLKSVIVGVLATLIAAGIIWFLSQTRRKNPKVLWTYEKEQSSLLKVTNNDFKYVTFHKMTLENVGSAVAKDVRLAFAQTEVDIECRSTKRYRHSLDRSLIQNNDVNFSRSVENGETVIVIRRIEKAQIVEVVSFVFQFDKLDFKGITFDSEQLEKVYSKIWFLSTRQLYLALFKSHGPIWLLGLSLIYQVIFVVPRIVKYIWTTT